MEIASKNLSEILGRLSGVLTNKGLVENSDKFVFNGDSIVVFNGETMICVEFDTGIKGAVQGASILKYLEKIGDVDIDIERVENSINIKKGRSVASFVVDDVDGMPLDISNIKWNKIPENFSKCIDACCPVCGNDFSDMRVVVMHVKDDYCESTDQQRLIRYQMTENIKDEFYIPVDLASFLTRVKVTHYSLDEEWIFFKNQQGDIICHRQISLADDYFDLGEIIAACNDGEEIQFPEKLYDSVEKASIFQNDIKIQTDRKITIRCKKGKIRIESNGMYGNYSEVIKTDIESDFQFVINPGFLTEIMEKSNKVCLSEESLRIDGDNYVFLTTLAAE